MSVSKVKVAIGLLSIPTALVISGCANCKASSYRSAERSVHRASKVSLVSDSLPSNANPGECFVKVFIPEQFDTRTETVCVRDASARLEIVPARYEWVEETVLVKEASCQLEEVPAQFETRQQTILTDAGHTGWQVERTARCVSDVPGNVADDMYCLVSRPPAYQTVDTQVQVRPATVREIPIPAEYQTVRRQKLVAPATTRRVSIPAEYASVEKTVKVADSRVEWQRVDCETELRAETTNTFNSTITRTGYTPRPE